MKKREFKNKAYGLLSQMVKAMANPHRLEIIDLLSQSGRTVEQIAIETDMSVANASQHLQVLKASGLVTQEREGNFIRYSLSDDKIYNAWYNLREIGFDRITNLDNLINENRKKKGTLEVITIPELMERLNTGKVMLLDIRPVEEYNAGHIPNALSVPIEKLAAAMKSLPRSKEYIAYCRGALCVFADDAVLQLKSSGYKAIRLEEGFPDWKLKGLEIEINN